MNHPTLSQPFKSLEFHPGQDIKGLSETINAIRFRVTYIRKRMRQLRAILNTQERFDPKTLDEYQELNDELRGVEIWKAEFQWHKNML